MNDKNWFAVDRAGLRALQAGKPKIFVLQELLQNAWDEAERSVIVSIAHDPKVTTIAVTDDGPGFRNIADAYTLFGDTYKRKDPLKRGRFNIGEKQVFSICQNAEIVTTCGSVTFDEDGRHHGKRKTEKGTVVTVRLLMSKEETQELERYVHLVITPPHITMTLNGEEQNHKQARHSIECNLATEKSDDEGIIRKTRRDTTIDLYEPHGEQPHLFEMGLPILPIEVPYHVDVRQRVPLNIDRDVVSPAFLKEVYGHVLNRINKELNEENVSSAWVRVASTSEVVTKDAMSNVLTKRFGENYVSASPNDPVANDDAIARGYKVISGSEMSAEEWKNAKDMGLVTSSHEQFGATLVGGTTLTPSAGMARFATFAKKVAKDFLGIDIQVEFVKSSATNSAQYGSRTLTMNVSNLGNGFFDNPTGQAQLDLLLHELGHEYGHHTEMAYHQGITRLGAKMIRKALTEPAWFNLE